MAKPESQRSRRAPKACDICRQKKIKCNGETPCQNCHGDISRCTYEFVSMRRKINNAYDSNVKYNTTINTAPETAFRPTSINSIINPSDSSVESIKISQIPSGSGLPLTHHSNVSSNSLSPSPPTAKRVKRQAEKSNSKNGAPDFEKRLMKMESMMEFLVERLCKDNVTTSSDQVPIQVQVQVPQASVETNSLPQRSASGTAQQSESQNSKSVLPPAGFSEKSITYTGSNNGTTEECNLRMGDDSNKSSLELREEIQSIMATHDTTDEMKKSSFFFPHSFSLFSNIGVKWVSSKLKSQQSLLTLKNLLSTVIATEHNLLAFWVEPTEKSQLVPFPSREICLAIGRYYCIKPAGFSEKIMALFNDYHDGVEGIKPARVFKNSQLMLMNTVLLMATTFCLEAVRMFNQKSILSQADLQKLQQSSLTNSLYYYHRCTLLNEDVHSIQAIIDLACYAEIIQMPQVTFMLASIAVRQAQACNLHRAEMYNGSYEENEFKIKLFWLCYILDRNVAMKTGKPPIMNDKDITTPPPKEIRHFWDLHGGTSAESKRMHAYNFMSQCLNSTDDRLIDLDLYLDMELASIISKAHTKLFSPASLSSKSEDEVYHDLVELLDCLEEFRLSIPEAIRPMVTGLDFSHIDALRNADLETSNDVALMNRAKLFPTVLTFHLVFHYVKMAVCNVLMKCNWYREYQGFRKTTNFEGSSEIKRLKDLEEIGLHASRAMIVLAQQVDSSSVYCANYCMYFPFAGIIALFSNCMQNPTADCVKQDIELLAETTRTYFNKTNMHDEHSRQKWDLIRNACAILVCLAVLRVSEQTGVTFDIGDIANMAFKDSDEKGISSHKSKKDRLDKHSSGSSQTNTGMSTSSGTSSGLVYPTPSPVGTPISAAGYSYGGGVTDSMTTLPVSNIRSDSIDRTGGALDNLRKGSPYALASSNINNANGSQMNDINSFSQIDPFGSSFPDLDSYVSDMAFQSFFDIPQLLFELDQLPAQGNDHR